MTTTLEYQIEAYADLLINRGVTLQPGQSLRIGAELEHAPFVRLLVAAAYRAGARYVHVDWSDTPTTKQRLRYSQPDYLEFLPAYEVNRHQEMVDDGWARIALTGDAYPDLLDDVDPLRLRTIGQVRAQKLRFYAQAQMSNRLAWCVAGVPTLAWAQKVFPQLTPTAALDHLWQTILTVCRVNQPDPVGAWQRQDQLLKQVVAFLDDHQVRTVRFVDTALDATGQPRTNLTIGLTDAPRWMGGGAQTTAGLPFLPNIPTEEVFSTPHHSRTEGWVRTSKPTFPLARKVENAYFRFEKGEVVDYRAEIGQEVLAQFFAIPGARRLGEVALVDIRSPIQQVNTIFYDILFDENAVSHIAFGEAYPEGLVGSETMDDETLAAHGVNLADTHVDFMIGTPTMNLYGQCADGREITLMVAGQFTADVLQGGA
ncbi:MAG: aminopeptidase [Caldilineaceae bacterium]|nr:aminopeptidase [Caldilineaceae bacterium]